MASVSNYLFEVAFYSRTLVFGTVAHRAVGKPFEKQAVCYVEDVYRFLHHLCRDPNRAQDLTQDTYLRAFRYQSSYDPSYSVKPWLMKIAHNVYREWLRRTSLELTLPVEDPPAAEPEIASFEEDLLERIPGAEILSALRSLPDEYREVVLLRDVEELSYREIAEVLQRPVGTVMSRLSRGRSLLQKKLFNYAKDRGLVRPESFKLRRFPGGARQ